MILDTFDNAVSYISVHRDFTRVCEFLRQSNLADLPAGRYEIDGDRLYAVMTRDAGHKKNDSLLEAHRKYIDLQMVLAGTEEMGWKPLASCRSVIRQYDENKDIVFFADRPDSWLLVRPGQFVIFYPEDAHMPFISDGMIHKVVVKIAVS